MTPLSPLRAAITATYRLPETEAVQALLARARLPLDQAQAVQALATRMAQTQRERKTATGRAGLVQGLLQEFSLSSQEGVALMCLAEALLRIPDAATRDALIRDKIGHGHWQDHLGQSPSLVVNAATWGLLLTGKLVSTYSEQGLWAQWGRLMAKGGEPLIRKGVDLAIRMMGEQFVTGEDITQALRNAQHFEAQGFRYSYDMLGEAALTAHDAQRYLLAYEQAIHAIGQAAAGRGVYAGPGISVKLSALHPRYSRLQIERVHAELYPRLLHLSLLAKRYDIGLNIDAEEADRLELSLDLLERLCHEPALAGWQGIGFVIQAYQKRCPQVVEYLIDLAQRSQHRLMIRLVKGAYWDSEIKRAQVDGQLDYPVYTRKAHTDVSYLACARRLLQAPQQIYAQFATHNAHTLAAIYHMAGPEYHEGQYEFQCLHGMGESLYEQVVGDVAQGQLGRPCRIYAPVGTHETLLAYLVRRLLENGANTSFVNRMADPHIPIADLVQDPVLATEAMGEQEGQMGLPHALIPLPRDLYGADRLNAQGCDLSDEHQLHALQQALQAAAALQWQAGPSCRGAAATAKPLPIFNPADHADQVGHVHEADADDAQQAITQALAAGPAWASTLPKQRAQVLENAAALLEQDLPKWMSLLMREAGKSHANAISEVREAVDFLRYYAAQVRQHFHNDTHIPLGAVVCISPWNFPLAIFTGQVAAALSAGNVVLAKPAEQTPLIAAQLVQLMWQAGVPREVLQFLPGRGETVGAALVADERVRGVMFTGSTEVARLLQQQLAGRLDARGRVIPLIAETGGQNVMIVDSSAQVEQVVTDVMASAFDSAGQRCSALRVLCVQEEAADAVLEMLKGAMAELCLGNPREWAVDVGPVIDASAQSQLWAHIEAMRQKGKPIFQVAAHAQTQALSGTFVAPTLIEIEGLHELQREVFGPVLHVLRYARRQLPQLLQDIQATGYGLTLGLHTRIDETIDLVTQHAHVGNVYVNRNMVGAVVGVQPFGGEGLSGTGPKAGGPLYVYRLLSQYPHGEPLGVAGPKRDPVELIGPTGERNTYAWVPKARVWCVAEDAAEELRLQQACQVLGIEPLTLTQDPGLEAAGDLVLHQGSRADLLKLCQQLAVRPGPIVGVVALSKGEAVPLERLLHERVYSINTAAAGGNASLMTLV